MVNLFRQQHPEGGLYSWQSPAIDAVQDAARVGMATACGSRKLPGPVETIARFPLYVLRKYVLSPSLRRPALYAAR